LRNLIYLFILFALVVTAFYFFYRDFEKPEQRNYDTLIAIPSTAAVVLETSDAADLWRDLSQNNDMWSQLEATDYFFRLNELGNTLDSLIRKQAELRNYLAERSVSVSIHASGAKGFNYLFSLQLEPDVDTDALHESIKALFRFEEFDSRIYGGESIISFKTPFLDGEIHYYQFDQSLVFSASELLLEESIRAVKQGASVLEDLRFLEVRETVDYGKRGHVYLNYAEFKPILSQYLGPEGREAAFFKQPYAHWSALDMSLSIDEIDLNGFVLAPDSSDSWLANFAGMEAPTPVLFDYLPANTAYFLYMGYGDYQSFRSDQLIRLEKVNRLYSLENQKKAYNEKCGCDAEDLATGWIGDQGLSFITEPASTSYGRNLFAIFHTDDAEEALESLRRLASGVSADPEKIEEEDEIFQLEIGSFYGDVVSDALSGLSDPFVGKIGEEVVVFANSKNALRTYLSSLEAGQGFTESAEFEKIRDSFFLDAHLILYSSMARSPYVYEKLLTPEFAESVKDYTELLRDFGSLIYQVGYSGNDLFYNGIYLRQSGTYSPETGTVWEVGLNSEIVGRPHLFENHYTGAMETLVQDDDQRIHLISSNGKVLWSKKLDGDIEGELHQVDVYKNKKLQMLFNTQNTVYLLDRNGNDVASFPVSLPSKASAPVSVADYDNSRDYRFFIPVHGGDILCFDAEGNQVDGWNFNSGGGDMILPIRHLRIKRKDYLFTLEENGKIHLLNRRGKTRHDVDRVANNFNRAAYRIELGNRIDQSALYYADSSGTLHRMEFDGGEEKIDPGNSGVQDCLITDLDQDGTMDFVVIYSEGLGAYSFSGDVLFETDLGELNQPKLTYHRWGSESRIAVTDQGNGKIFLFDDQGQSTSAIPLFGNLPPVVGDINLNGYPDLISASRSGFVYAYTIE